MNKAEETYPLLRPSLAMLLTRMKYSVPGFNPWNVTLPFAGTVSDCCSLVLTLIRTALTVVTFAVLLGIR